ncbi:sodium:proton antiporter NhaD [Aestuariibacter salexigens]|uniref:sodium:proton antiporter NhaD n=1 Tax=Aestuariibacter salexigens TaxID=226010 RepID=UPI000A00EAB4|nr:sodium:proton antiporter NhaD [Aestuariibacter salexigens]
MTSSWVGIASLGIFLIAYVFIILEDKIHLRKSKPIMIGASLVWLLIAIYAHSKGQIALVAPAMNGYFLEYAQLFFFLLVAMTYVNSMLERGVFDSLRYYLVSRGSTFRSLFWTTGVLAFCISPIADNLTTALILCAVVMAVANGHARFVSLCCINIVVAANAGGAFSPFGDITTLMVWQAGVVEFIEFFDLLIPSLINFLLPAAVMHFFVPRGVPARTTIEAPDILHGGIQIVGLFLLTIMTAICLHFFLEIPPVYGMLLGLGYLKLYGFYLRTRSHGWTHGTENPPGSTDDPYDFDVFSKIAHAEWDTLFFFYGVILAVGGLSFIGYLDIVSHAMYGNLDATTANVLVGILSAFVDNIPVMFAVLTMQPDMPHVQWLLVTLTAGVGGSLLSIGSAAGVALMGQARGYYTFAKHLIWTPVIALGYGASIWVHLLING